MKEIFKYFFFLIVLSGCYLSEDVPEDQDIWNYSLPSDQGLNDAILLELDQAIESEQFGNTRGMIVIKNDDLIFENYYNGNSRATLFPIGRAGTGVVAALFGEVLNNELANQIDMPIASFFPEYNEIFDANPDKRNITIRHLLTMTEGLAWNESVTPVNEANSDLGQMLASDDFIEYILSRQLEAPPGNRFSYSTGNNILLLNLMDRLLDEPLEDFFRTRLFEPLKITNIDVQSMPNGLPNYSTGLSLSTLDFTKIGYLLIKNGNWDGIQIIDERWVNSMLDTQEQLDVNRDFGFQWWRFNETSFISNNYGIDDFFFIFGETSQGIYLSRDGQFVITINNGFDISRNFATPSFFIFTRILDSTVI